jgi:hypothetical protein
VVAAPATTIAIIADAVSAAVVCRFGLSALRPVLETGAVVGSAGVLVRAAGAVR